MKPQSNEAQVRALIKERISHNESYLAQSTIKLMILHLYWEHNLGIRKVAKRLGVPMKYVKNVVLTSEDYTVD